MTMSKLTADQPGGQVRIVALCGSLREGSFTRRALHVALQGAQSLGAETEVLDLRDYDLIFCDGHREDDELPEKALRLRQKVRQADGILLGTPEYHGGYSGVLKNALDLMGFREFEGKMIGLLAVSGGSMGAANALNSLRTVCRSLRAWVVPHQVSITQGWKQFDQSGNLRDADLAQRVHELGRQVARFAYLLTSEKAMEFLEAWEGAPVNPGGE